jgi:hypothetical protein
VVSGFKGQIEVSGMAANKDRPEGGPQDFSFLSGTGDSPAVSHRGSADKESPTILDEAESVSFASWNSKDAVTRENSPPRSLESPAPKITENSEPAQGLTEKLPAFVLGYAIALTLLLLFFLLTGRISFSTNHALESLPDIRPLPPTEFRKVPEGTTLPDGHAMRLGESRRFGDVVLTPIRVTREPLKFQGFLSGESEESLTTVPVLKLWLKFENVADDYGFPPFDAGLMSYRSPPTSTDESTAVNSFLILTASSKDKSSRVLNYLQTMDSNFVLTGQESARVIMPGQTLSTFVACSEEIAAIPVTGETDFTWRIQFRKGVHQSSGNGVTTLVDVNFSGSDIGEEIPISPVTPAAG